MGLQNTANYLQSKGRGKDTMLVHMSPREVKGLQAIALRHGGSLTINPTTGLPEAGFLENILPMVAGAALTVGSGGALSPLAAGLIVGGGYGLATGSITKGLMAGLGAYGGAGLGTSLGALGAEATAATTQQAAVEGYKQTAEEAAKASLGEAGTANLQALNPGSQGPIPSEFAREMGTPGFNMPSAGLPSTQSVTTQAAENYLNVQNPAFSKVPAQALQDYRSALYTPGANPQDVISAAGRAQGSMGATTSGNMMAGLKAINPTTEAGRTALGGFAKDNALTLGTAFVPSLIGGEQQGAGPAGYQSDEYDERLRKYKLSPNYQAYEAPRPDPYYQAQYPTYAAQGGVMELAAGGSFDDELGGDYSAMGMDQGNMQKGLFGMGYAAGGVARYRSKGQVNVLQDYLDRQEQQQISPLPESVGVPRTGIFRDTDVDTARKDALTAAMIRLGKASKGAGIKTVALPKTSIKGLGDISGVTQDTTEAAAGGTMRYNLGGYSDGGRMLKGPGDGMSDSIPASIAGKQPARLADGEFVVPADVVSHLGNGSTDAGAKKLYGMMDRIRKARTGKKKQAPAVKTARYMPA